MQSWNILFYLGVGWYELNVKKKNPEIKFPGKMCQNKGQIVAQQMDVNYDIFMLLSKWNKAMQQELHATNTIA